MFPLNIQSETKYHGNLVLRNVTIGIGEQACSQQFDVGFVYAKRAPRFGLAHKSTKMSSHYAKPENALRKAEGGFQSILCFGSACSHIYCSFCFKIL